MKLQTLELRAYAKLNLFLDITGRRADGYHELKTVMQSVSIYDELTFTLTEGAGLELSCDRGDLPVNDDNLVVKGIKAVLNYAYFQPGCKISVRLKKRIPSGAGMGGGSADCAAAIIAMNELFHLELTRDELIAAAKMCGADVPFCVTGGTALCEGIGEKITPLPSPDELIFAVVKPSQSISTPAAYKSFDTKGKPAAGDCDGFAAALESGSADRIGSKLYNAFTAADEPVYIERIKSSLIRCGAYGAEMTGSGSAVFGVFNKNERDTAELAVRGVPRSCSESGVLFGEVCRPVPHGVEIVQPNKPDDTPEELRAFRGKYLDPARTADITKHLPQIKHCAACFDRVSDEPLLSRRIWYITPERDGALCEKCFDELRDKLDIKATDGGIEYDADTEWY
ncbi:MAG: 4-(cytidine 5'-diphospho)-2-C-methyl-D-erythritol kinase [Ruminococcus sp.]|nr:4-(cytidine 5'-diphospho)-2-C-methyl-D-erythritol kinase [Ruminococcus sp.]